MEMKEVVAKPEQLILSGYGPGQFRLGMDILHKGSLLLLPEGPQTWPVAAVAELTPDHVAPIIEARREMDIILIGVGKTLTPLPRIVRQTLEAADVPFEVMDTGAACRTFNVLLEEQRRVFAALIAV